MPKRSFVERHAPFVGVVVAMVCVSVIGGFLRDGFFGSVRAVYAAFTVWLPAVLLAVVVVIRFLRYRALRHPLRPLLLLALLLLLLRFYASVLEPSRLQVRRIDMVSSRVSRPLRILHISDIQVFEFGCYESRVLGLMKDLKPDIVLHTGDLAQPARVAQVHGIVAEVASGLRGVEAPMGVYGVMGDTDWRLVKAGVGAEQLAPLVMLENRGTDVVAGGGDTLALLGMTLDVSRDPDRARGLVDGWLAAAPAGLRVVLGHNPDYVMGLEGADVDICLAGHTHGGQIRIPFIGPLLTMTHHIPREYALGHRMLGKTMLNVSAGIGSEHAGRVPPIRFLCPPDMTLITVRPASE
jgi:predicted MPP superfamily phosphohydrolase